MHHHKTYIYINFQQNRVNRSVITVYTKLFAKNRKLHKVATTNSIFFLNHSFRHASCKTYMYITFQQNRVSRSVKKILKAVHTNLFAKKCKLHKFATTNSNFEKIDY